MGLYEIMAGVTAELKRVYQKPGELKEQPNFYPGYVEAVEYREQIRPHAEKGVFPEQLFRHRSPNETEEEQNYRRDIYKQVTLPVYLDYRNAVGRGFIDSNWKIDFKEEPSGLEARAEGIKDYLTKAYPEYNSLQRQVKSVLLDEILKDPNAVMAVVPEDIDTIEYERDEEGTLLVDDREFTRPVAKLYEAGDVLYYKEGQEVLLMSKQKSLVSYSNQIQRVGYVFIYINREVVVRIEQVGKLIDWEFEEKYIFDHSLDYLPAQRLKGVPQLVEDGLIFQSPFLFAVDNLDLVTLNESNLQVSVNTSVYPYKIMYANACDFEAADGAKCNNGVIERMSDGEFVNTTCPACYGNGLKPRMSPMGVMLIKPSDTMEEGDKGFTQDPLKFVSPDVSTLEFLIKKIDRDEGKARAILHLQTSETQAEFKGDETATAKTIELKELYGAIKPTVDRLFELWEFAIKSILEMRYKAVFGNIEEYLPELTSPISFDFKTAEDYLEDVKSAMANNLPPYVVATVIEKFLKVSYGNESEAVEAFDTIVKADTIATFTNGDVEAALRSKTIEPWRAILHFSGLQIWNELRREVDGFDGLEQEEKIAQLREKAKEMAAEIATGTATRPSNSENLLNSIIGRNQVA